MKQPSLYKLRGAVRITVTGGDIETLINTVAEQGLEVWNLRAHDGRVAEMNILLPHFFRLRPVLKRTGCRVKVTHRSGFPFLRPDYCGGSSFLGGCCFLWQLCLRCRPWYGMWRSRVTSPFLPTRCSQQRRKRAYILSNGGSACKAKTSSPGSLHSLCRM